jgi:hypothetical protein
MRHRTNPNHVAAGDVEPFGHFGHWHGPPQLVKIFFRNQICPDFRLSIVVPYPIG